MSTWKASLLRPWALFDALSDDEFRTRIEAGNLLEGTNITYSGGRGHAVVRLLGTFTGTTGGFHGLYSRVDTSGVFVGDNPGVVGIKSLVQNTADLTDGNVYGGQSIAKHAHSTSRMTASATLVGFESVAYQSAAGDVYTMLGLNAVVRADGTPDAYGAGSVHRGIQVVLDYPANKPEELTGICIWNMSGSPDHVLNVVNSGSGFTNFAKFTDDGAPAQSTGTRTSESGWIKVLIGSATRYIRLYTT